MGIYEFVEYQIVCDEIECYTVASECDSERQAKNIAAQEGFVERNGKWFCPKCAIKKENK